MTPAEWIGIATGTVGTVTGAAALGRLLVTHGADRAKTTQNSDWIKDHSVERVDFENLERRMDDAAAKAEIINLERRLDEAASKSEVAGLTRRVDVIEGDVSEVAKLLTDIRVEFGQITGQLASQKELITLQFETLKHSVSNLKQVVEGLATGRIPRA